MFHVREAAQRHVRTGVHESMDPTHHSAWDFNEYNGYRTYAAHLDDGSETFVHVRWRNSAAAMSRSAKVLLFLDAMTRKAQAHCMTSRDPRTRLFAATRHTFYELPQGLSFRGVNKPKNVHECAHAEADIGKDGKLRAHERYVMLAIEHLTRQHVKSLFVHELAHTLANHVLFRVDDHGPDFQACERIVEKCLAAVGFDAAWDHFML